MNINSTTKFELERIPTGPELGRRATVEHGVYNLEQALKNVEEAIKAYLVTQQKINDTQSNNNLPDNTLAHSTEASITDETIDNNEIAARNAVAEVFKNAN